jgi:hypothetical protein
VVGKRNDDRPTLNVGILSLLGWPFVWRYEQRPVLLQDVG